MTGKTLTDYQHDYLELRRAMGHPLVRHESLIGAFLTEVDAAGQSVITIDAAARWASAGGVGGRRAAVRLAVIRGFVLLVSEQSCAGVQSPACPIQGSSRRPRCPCRLVWTRRRH